MLSRELKINKIDKWILVVVLMMLLLLYSACGFSKGSILILEKHNGTAFTISMNAFNTYDKWEMRLLKGQEIQVEINREDGEIALTVSGKNGSEPYEGNNLESGVFTFTVSESDDYIFQIKGKYATGKISVKNLGLKETDDENHRLLYYNKAKSYNSD